MEPRAHSLKVLDGDRNVKIYDAKTGRELFYSNRRIQSNNSNLCADGYVSPIIGYSMADKIKGSGSLGDIDMDDVASDTDGAFLLGLEFADINTNCTFGFGGALSYEMERETKIGEFSIFSIEVFAQFYINTP